MASTRSLGPKFMLIALVGLFLALPVKPLQASFWVSSARLKKLSSVECGKLMSENSEQSFELSNRLIEYRPDTQSLIRHEFPENVSGKDSFVVLQNQQELVLNRFLEKRLEKISNPRERIEFEHRIRSREHIFPKESLNYVIGQSESLNFSFRLAVLSQLDTNVRKKSILGFLEKNASTAQQELLTRYPNIVQLGLLHVNPVGRDFKFSLFKIISVELKEMFSRDWNFFNFSKMKRRIDMGMVELKPTLFIGVLKKGLAPRLYQGLKYEHFRNEIGEKLLTKDGSEIVFVDATSFIYDVGHSVHTLENALRFHYGHPKKRNYMEELQLKQGLQYYLNDSLILN